MSKSIRVWVPVDDGMPVYHLVGALRETVEGGLDLCIPAWRESGITIRRAALVLDPVKPRKRKGAA